MAPYSNIAIIAFLFALVPGVPSQTSRSCKSPNVCVEIWKCPFYVKLLQESRGNRKTIIAQVRKNFCGVNRNIPEVCCSQPSTAEETLNVEDDIGKNINLDLLPLESCGKITDGLRITSGVNASPGEFPWMALIAYANGDQTEDTQFRCGGTLITERFVLTAAHCIGSSILGVRLGEYNTESEIDCDQNGRNCQPPTQDLLINKILVHPLYNPTTLVNDIALIKLATRANLTSGNVKPICLPVYGLGDKKLTGRRLTVSGWGVTEAGERSSILRKVSIPVIPLKNCQNLYQAFKPITTSQICAGAYKGRDSCEGDSGGPLMTVDLIDDSPRYVQFGIVSYGPKHCGLDGRPGVYTNIGKYLDWILDSLK